MLSGTLFFDERKIDISSKILNLSKFYYEKRGVYPSFCNVSPEMFSEVNTKDEGGYKIVHNIKVSPDRLVKKNYFYIGVNADVVIPTKSYEEHSTDTVLFYGENE